MSTVSPRGYVSPPIRFSSSGAGADAQEITTVLEDIYRHQVVNLPSRSKVVRQLEDPLAHRLFDSLVQVKLLTSQVAMHLDTEWRNLLFEQLDDLLDVDDCRDDDPALVASSFETFLRMITYHGPMRRPGLGLSNRGFLIGAWTRGSDRLTMEFFPKDSIRWVLSCLVDGEIERAAGETPSARITAVLSPFDPARWFQE